jgi:ankyrin repeat protein
MNFWNNLILGKKGRFMNSALEGDLTEVKAMLAARVNVNAKRDDANVTALILASQNGHLEVVQFLLDAGADVNVETNDGATALMVAAHNCHLEVVQALLAAGADVNARMLDGKTASMLAPDHGNQEVSQLLNETSERIEDFFDAVRSGDVNQVSAMHAAKANVNWKDSDGNTALICASQEGHLETVQVLLTAMADVNAKNEYGETALMWASRNCHKGIVQTLLASKANANAKDVDGNTALIWAALYSHLEIRDNKQKNPNFQEDNFRHRLLEIVLALLAAGADVNAKTAHFSTKARIGASLRGRKDLPISLTLSFKYECDAMAEVDAISRMTDGNTALMEASSIGHIEMVLALLEAGADVNARRRDGRTALIAALSNGNQEIVKLLKKMGAVE